MELFVKEALYLLKLPLYLDLIRLMADPSSISCDVLLVVTGIWKDSTQQIVILEC